MKTPVLDDLTPFFNDPCWMFVLLARQADVAVILRRGPTKWCHVTLWDTRRDLFQSGQWFHGRIYPERCDLSPDGKLFIYFAGKFRARDKANGYDYTWTAVSRPPYLTALALWPIGDTWGGGGVFIDNRTVLFSSFSADHHPNHPPGPLKVLTYSPIERNDPRRQASSCWRNGWEATSPTTPSSSNWKKVSDRLTLEHDIDRMNKYLYPPSRRRSLYTVSRINGEAVALFEAHWADWDQRGRLVAAVGGRILSGELTKNGKLQWRQLAALHEEKPTRLEAPKWAQHW